MIALLITAVAALAFIRCLLLKLAGRRWQHAESAYAGSHGRAPHQPPGRILRHAIATGIHGLGVIGKSDGSETICTLTAIRLASGLVGTVVVRVG